MASQKQGIDLCKLMYEELKGVGFYPALTGGALYKDGARKDIDIVIFRNRQNGTGFEMNELSTNLKNIGLTDLKYFGFVTKAKFEGTNVDIFNPETKLDDEY